MKRTKGNGINGFAGGYVGLCRSLLDSFRHGDYLCLSGQLKFENPANSNKLKFANRYFNMK